MYGSVLVKRKPGETLEGFHGHFCAALNVAAGEQRFSDNYAGGTYFRSMCLGIHVQLEFADDSQFPDYDWCVHVSPRLPIAAAHGSVSTMDGIAALVANELAAAGYVVLRK